VNYGSGRLLKRRLKPNAIYFSQDRTGGSYLWGGPPGPRPTRSSAWSPQQEIDSVEPAAGPGGLARTRGSAPQFWAGFRMLGKVRDIGLKPVPPGMAFGGLQFLPIYPGPQAKACATKLLNAWPRVAQTIGAGFRLFQQLVRQRAAIRYGAEFLQ